MSTSSKNNLAFGSLPFAGKLFLGLLIVAAICAGYYFLFHSDLSDSIDNADSQYAQLQNRLRAAERRQQEYLEATAELARREPIDRQNLRVLPEESEMAAFLEDLNRLAELSGLEIKLVQPQPEERSQDYIRLPVTLSLKGRYHQVAKFFYSVSRLERAINMEDVELTTPRSRNQQRSDQGEDEIENITLQIDVMATTFRRPPPPEPRGGANGPANMGMAANGGMR